MCGIAGFWAAEHVRDSHLGQASLDAMVASLRHRGPDSDGTWGEPTAGVAFGHSRLSILDLSPQGHQPMESPDGRYVVVFNGEIYNFDELRRELTRRGHAFRGHSDTEVLLAGFMQWGLRATLERCVGMFALALWDAAEGCLYLARDRMGEKPLYYALSGKHFLFASELKALRRHHAFEPEVDRNALTLYLRHAYVPAPYSIYRGVYKLPPGSLLCMAAGDLAANVLPTPEPYWSLREAVAQGAREPFVGDDREATDHLDRLLGNAVRMQTVADVPVGAFLSGGIDSSTIVALMQAAGSRPVKTFTVGFHESAYNEARHAKKVAEHLGTDHTELYVTHREAQAVIPKLHRIYDEPFGDSSQIPTFLVAELARRHVTVSLSGDAGDELFGGYSRYDAAFRVWNKIRLIPYPLRRVVGRSLNAVTPGAWAGILAACRPALPAGLRGDNAAERVNALASLVSSSKPSELYRHQMSHWKAPGQVVIRGTEYPSLLTAPSSDAPVALADYMMYVDSMTYLPDDILVKVDRAAMATSLETRIPLLDHRIVEFAWTLPQHMKRREGVGKWLLRQVLQRYVPRELVERPKMGFGIPLDLWLREGLRDWAEDLLSEERLRREGFFDPAPIRRMWQEHLSGRFDRQFYLWDILMFEAWLNAS